jgi:hypothetical protein
MTGRWPGLHPRRRLVTLPGLDHFGPETKRKVVAHTGSAFFTDHV